MILWLEDPACQEIAWTGGKAANLSRLAATHLIPPGFCLTTAAYSQWAHASQAGSIPPELGTQLAEAYLELARRTNQDSPAVAVRSSAVAEDGANASFAGQYETYLNIVGIAALVTAVTRCWGSAQVERVQTYQPGVALPATQLAVLVQTIVPADCSFVAFSANPVTGALDEVVINASWGLGESVVSGIVTPDTYVVRKTDRQINTQSIADKQWMTVAFPVNTGAQVGEGVQQLPVPRFLRNQPALTAAQVTDVAALTIALATQMGWPVDIEGAYHGDKLYLLQCRPISTL